MQCLSRAWRCPRGTMAKLTPMVGDGMIEQVSACKKGPHSFFSFLSVEGIPLTVLRVYSKTVRYSFKTSQFYLSTSKIIGKYSVFSTNTLPNLYRASTGPSIWSPLSNALRSLSVPSVLTMPSSTYAPPSLNQLNITQFSAVLAQTLGQDRVSQHSAQPLHVVVTLLHPLCAAPFMQNSRSALPHSSSSHADGGHCARHGTMHERTSQHALQNGDVGHV